MYTIRFRFCTVFIRVFFLFYKISRTKKYRFLVHIININILSSSYPINNFGLCSSYQKVSVFIVRIKMSIYVGRTKNIGLYTSYQK